MNKFKFLYIKPRPQLRKVAIVTYSIRDFMLFRTMIKNNYTGDFCELSTKQFQMGDATFYCVTEERDVYGRDFTHYQVISGPRGPGLSRFTIIQQLEAHGAIEYDHETI